MTVYFHGNFGLNRANMARLLEMALKDPKKRDKELAKPFGYGAPFAARTRSWLHKTGIIELRFPIQLTPMGEVVWENDPKLENLTTQWFMHWELTTHPTRAEAWHYFYHEFLPMHQSFSKEQLIDGLTQKLRSHSEEHFGSGSPLNVVIARKIIECYAGDYALVQLGIIASNGDILTRGNYTSTIGPWNSPTDFAKTYAE